MGRFDFGSNHPFKPERATKTYDLCNRYGVLSYPWMKVVDPQPIDPELLTLFHEPEYIKLLSTASRGEVCIEMLARGLRSAEPLSSKGSTIGPAVLQGAPTPPCAIFSAARRK